MKKNRIWLYAVLAVTGIALLFTGHYILIGEDLKTLSGLFTGIGAAAFVLGIGNFIGAIVITKTQNEEITRRKNIEVNDERNTQIREKSAYQTLRILQYLLYAVTLILALSNAPLYITLIFAGIIVLETILLIIFSSYYQNRL